MTAALLENPSRRTAAAVPGPAAAAEPALAATRAATWIVFTLFCVLPVVQLGITYELAPQYLGFVLVVLTVRKHLPLRDWSIVAFICCAMFLGIFWHLDADELGGAILRNLREAIAAVMILCAARNVSWVVPRQFLHRMLLAVILGLFLLTAAQFVFYEVLKSPRFFVPASYFITGQTTLPQYWLEYGQKNGFLAQVRVSATYSEPSYLSFVCLSLAVMVRNAGFGRALYWLSLSLLLVTVALSKSASGPILLMLLIVYLHRRGLVTPQRALLVLGAAAVAMPIAANVLDFNPIERIVNIANPRTEESGYIRFVMPFKHIATILTDSPFGVPWTELYGFLLARSGDYSGLGPVDKSTGMWVGQDNGLLNLLIEFGWGGLVIIGGIVAVIRDRFILLYLLFVMQFNGAPFGPDKVAVICLALSTRPGSPAATPVRPALNAKRRA